MSYKYEYEYEYTNKIGTSSAYSAHLALMELLQQDPEQPVAIVCELADSIDSMI